MADVTFKASFKTTNNLNADFGQVTKVSTSNYEDLYNKPILNSRTIIGDKVSADYGLQDKMDVITEQMIDNMIFGG